MYSIKATRMHVKNGASLSTPSPAIVRSTSPESLPPTSTSIFSTGYEASLGNSNNIASRNPQHARVSPIKSLIDTGSAESTPVNQSQAPSSSDQRGQRRAPMETNITAVTNVSVFSKEKALHSQRSQNTQSSSSASNYFDKHFDFTYSSSDMDHSPIQIDPSTPPMRNSEVSDMTPPQRTSPISMAHDTYESPTNCKIPSPIHNKTKSVKITITKQKSSPPPLKTSIIQSPTRVRTSPTNLTYSKRNIPLFYSPLLMRQIKQQQEDEKNQRHKEKSSSYFSSYKGYKTGVSSSSTVVGCRKSSSSPFSCLNPVDDCFPETPPLSSSTEELLLLWNNNSSTLSSSSSSSSSLLLNQYNTDLFLDLGDSILDPPPCSELMTHENRWTYQSNLAGQHKQEMHILDLSHRIYTSPISLLYGVPPQAASKITTLKYNAIHLDSQNLSFLLELMGRIFPILSSLSIQISQTIVVKEDDPAFTVIHHNTRSGGIRPVHHQYDVQWVQQKQRIYILHRLPKLSIINDILVTDEERQGIVFSSMVDTNNNNMSQSHSNGSMKNQGQVEYPETVKYDSSPSAAANVNRSYNPTEEERANESFESSIEAYEEDDSTVHRSSSLLGLVGRSYSWSYSDHSDPMDLRISHSLDEIDFTHHHSLAWSYQRRQYSRDSSLSDLSDRVMKMKLDSKGIGGDTTRQEKFSSNVDAQFSTALQHRSSRPNNKSMSYRRKISISSTSTSNDDDNDSESSSLGNQVPSCNIENNHYFSSTDSRADSPMPVQYRIKNIEDQLKYRSQNDSESDSCSGEYMSSRIIHKDEAAAKRKYTRAKKDSSLPPTSPASMPRATAHRVKKQKPQVTISNMDTLRKVRPIADKMFDDDDDDEQVLEEQESVPQFDL